MFCVLLQLIFYGQRRVGSPNINSLTTSQVAHTLCIPFLIFPLDKDVSRKLNKPILSIKVVANLKT